MTVVVSYMCKCDRLAFSLCTYLLILQRPAEIRLRLRSVECTLRRHLKSGGKKDKVSAANGNEMLRTMFFTQRC
jgi:hypothetical protein